VLLAILKSHEDTEDALQELFLRVASGRTKERVIYELIFTPAPATLH
jgi:hypothetical protein